MPQLESPIERRFAEYARSKGCKVVKMVDPSDPDAPDRAIMMPNGFTVYMEFKRLGKRLREGQDRYLSWLVDNGHRAAWTDNFEDAKNWLERILEK